jgi:F-type H+-transporting ATPase subunit b
MIFLAFAENSIQLVPDGTLLLHLLTIVVMVFILNRTLFRPINKVLADREAETLGREREAKKLRTTVEGSLLKYERGLREARAGAYHMIEMERVEALKLREQEVTKVREEIRSMVRSEKAEIDRQVERAQESLRVEAVTIAREIGSQILHRSV